MNSGAGNKECDKQSFVASSNQVSINFPVKSNVPKAQQIPAPSKPTISTPKTLWKATTNIVPVQQLAKSSSPMINIIKPANAAPKTTAVISPASNPKLNSTNKQNLATQAQQCKNNTKPANPIAHSSSSPNKVDGNTQTPQEKPMNQSSVVTNVCFQQTNAVFFR